MWTTLMCSASNNVASHAMFKFSQSTKASPTWMSFRIPNSYANWHSTWMDQPAAVSCFSISCAECLSVLSSTDFRDSSTRFVNTLLQLHVFIFHFQAVYFLLEDFLSTNLSRLRFVAVVQANFRFASRFVGRLLWQSPNSLFCSHLSCHVNDLQHSSANGVCS